jgi:hypothetical protein
VKISIERSPGVNTEPSSLVPKVSSNPADRYLGIAHALKPEMETKPRSHTGKAEAEKPSDKQVKGTTETARLFFDVAQAGRRSPMVPLTRYVE